MIQRFVDWLVYDVFCLEETSRLAIAVKFFVYDSVKIILLLFTISLVMGVINAYFPIERLRNYLSTHKLYGLDYFLVALFGGITPFCSCSSVPLFIGFCCKGYSSWYRNCFYDGYNRAFDSRGNYVKKGNDLAIDWNIFWRCKFVDCNIGLFV